MFIERYISYDANWRTLETILLILRWKRCKILCCDLYDKERILEETVEGQRMSLSVRRIVPSVSEVTQSV